MSTKGLDLVLALTADPDTNDVDAANTPPLDDNTKKLATTEFLRQQFAGAGKQSLSTVGYQRLPGGLTLHWGVTSVPAASTIGQAAAGVLPGKQIIFATGNVSTPTGSASYNIGVSVRGVGFPDELLLQNTDTVSHDVFWFALSA